MSRLERLPSDQQHQVLALAVLAAKARQRRATTPIVRAFASPEHERFYHSEAPELVASGWMGAGKSRVLCEKAWDLALAHPGAELGLFRKVQSSLAATTERTFWQDVVDPSLVVERNRSEHWVDVGSANCRSRIWLLGLDADASTNVPSKVGSLNLDWAGVDEAVELTEADWIMLGGRLRRTAMPFRQLAAATNPAAPTHWLKCRFTPPTEAQEWITIHENRFLPDDYRLRLASLGNGVHAQRLAQGLWVGAEGQIWLLPPEQIRAAPEQPWDLVVAGIDWGYRHAFACEVVGMSGSGRVAVLDELVVRGETLDRLIPSLARLEETYGIEAFFADPSEPAFIEQCQHAGLSVVGARNHVLPGLEAVADALAGGMTIDPRCSGLLAEIPGYVWSTERGSGRLRELPHKANDDACDALRYAVMGLGEPVYELTLVEDYVHISPY